MRASKCIGCATGDPRWQDENGEWRHSYDGLFPHDYKCDRRDDDEGDSTQPHQQANTHTD